MGFKTECARECLHAAVSHTTLLTPYLTKRAILGLSKLRTGVSNVISGPKTRRKISLCLPSVTVSVSRHIKASGLQAFCAYVSCLYNFFFLYTGWPVQFPQVRNSAVPPAPVQRFVCVHCTATGHLSSRGLFLHRSAVLRRRDIRGSKPCFAADLGFKEIHVEARACDVMAGAGGAAGPAPDVRHQPPG